MWFAQFTFFFAKKAHSLHEQLIKYRRNKHQEMETSQARRNNSQVRTRHTFGSLLPKLETVSSFLGLLTGLLC